MPKIPERSQTKTLQINEKDLETVTGLLRFCVSSWKVELSHYERLHRPLSVIESAKQRAAQEYYDELKSCHDRIVSNA